MAFVKLDCGILDSSLWVDHDARNLFVTALLMARPHEVREPLKTVKIGSTEEDNFVLPPGWYGLVSAASTGIIHRTGIERRAGMEAMERLCAPDTDSRTPDYEGRRMVRVDGGFIVLNFDKYRQKDHTAAERARRYRLKRAEDATVTRDVTVERVTDRSVTQAECRVQSAESDKKDTDASSSAAEPSDPVQYDRVREDFHRLCPSLPKIRDLTEPRRKAIRARWKNANGQALARFEELFAAAQASDFLSGRNGEWSGCSFDWLMNPTNAQKVLEGNYSNDRKKANGSNGHTKPAPTNIRDGIDESKFVAWYYATYPPTVRPGMTLLTASAGVIERYKKENQRITP